MRRMNSILSGHQGGPNIARIARYGLMTGRVIPRHWQRNDSRRDRAAATRASLLQQWFQRSHHGVVAPSCNIKAQQQQRTPGIISTTRQALSVTSLAKSPISTLAPTSIVPHQFEQHPFLTRLPDCHVIGLIQHNPCSGAFTRLGRDTVTGRCRASSSTVPVPY